MSSTKKKKTHHPTEPPTTKILYFVREAAEVSDVPINSWRELLWRKFLFLYTGKSIPEELCIWCDSSLFCMLTIS